jgi:hypothetical protein
MASERWFDDAHHRVMRGLVAVLLLGVCGLVKAQEIANFEDLALGAGSYWNGSDGSGGFASGNAWFNNNYDTMYQSWDGFAYSNISNTSAKGLSSQYNAITGSGQGGSANYAVGYAGWTTLPTMTLDEPTIVGGLYVTNNNYAYYSMLYGDAFAKKFGGSAGSDADWFLLTMTGKDATGAATGKIVFYLADYQFADNQLDYIVDDWQYVSLASLGVVKSVEFSLDSSDKLGGWLNTPGYFVIDTVVPEPASAAMMTIGAGILALKRRWRRANLSGRYGG